MKKILQKIFVIIMFILFLLITIPSSYLFFSRKILDKPNASFFGYASAVIVSGSMSNTIEINDYIITQSIDNYKVDDIIMFVSSSGKSLVTHRIICITEDGIQTKGDANNTPDNELISKDRIVGKVIKVIPNIGLLFAYISSPWGILCVFLVGVLAIEGPYILKRLTRNKDTNIHTKKE